MNDTRGHTWAVILAGGSGTRFWPASRQKTPKQYLPLSGETSLLQDTAKRLKGLLPLERTLVITSGEQSDLVREHLPKLPTNNLICEPCGRNTAPCIGLAAMVLLERDPEAIMLVMPSDHAIRAPERWRSILTAAAVEAETPGRTVVFGIPPDRPHTGYGYIRFGKEQSQRDGEAVFDVRSFHEKPDLATAREFLANGDHYWNSGCFAWRADTYLELCRKHIPALAKGLDTVGEGMPEGLPSPTTLAEVYPSLPNVSVDYGILEKARDIVAFRANIRWNDLGSWAALSDQLERDGTGNCGRGDRISIDSRDCVVYGPNKLVALIGVEGLAVVATDDAILVCAKDKDQLVRQVVQRLKDAGKDEFI